MTLDDEELLGFTWQHLGEHVGRAIVTGGQVPSQLTKLPSRHFTTHSGHGSLHPTMILPPKHDLLEHAELWENADEEKLRIAITNSKQTISKETQLSFFRNFMALQYVVLTNSPRRKTTKKVVGEFTNHTTNDSCDF
jgi:hypothetical protein